MDYLELAQQLGIQGFVRGNEFRARCPLHNDNHPSFSLNRTTGAWKCFSRCGHGSFQNLVQAVLGCSVQEAYEWVASNGSKATVDRAISSLEAQLFPQQPLAVPSTGQGWEAYFRSISSFEMPNWFLDRGFTWQTVNHWNIRYSSVLDAVTVPVYWQQQLVGTVTRNHNPSLPKYQNSPNLPRSEILFGEISRSSTYIMICEGALDLLWLWQNGYNAIGLLGNDLSEKQIELLRQYRFNEIVLALDNDEGGRSGTEKISRLLIQHGWLLHLTTIKFSPDKKDPNDCNPGLLQELFEQRKSILQFSI